MEYSFSLSFKIRVFTPHPWSKSVPKYCIVLEGSASLQHILSKQNPAVYPPVLTLLHIISFLQLIKVCLRIPLPSSRVLRFPGQARFLPNAPQRRLIPAWGPAPSSLHPLEANKGSKMPLTLAKLLGQRYGVLQVHMSRILWTPYIWSV